MKPARGPQTMFLGQWLLWNHCHANSNGDWQGSILFTIIFAQAHAHVCFCCSVCWPVSGQLHIKIDSKLAHGHVL